MIEVSGYIFVRFFIDGNRSFQFIFPDSPAGKSPLHNIIIVSAREWEELRKSCKLISCWSGRNFLLRTVTAARIVNFLPFSNFHPDQSTHCNGDVMARNPCAILSKNDSIEFTFLIVAEFEGISVEYCQAFVQYKFKHFHEISHRKKEIGEININWWT